MYCFEKCYIKAGKSTGNSSSAEGFVLISSDKENSNESN